MLLLRNYRGDFVWAWTSAEVASNGSDIAINAHSWITACTCIFVRTGGGSLSSPTKCDQNEEELSVRKAGFFAHPARRQTSILPRRVFFTCFFRLMSTCKSAHHGNLYLLQGVGKRNPVFSRTQIWRREEVTTEKSVFIFRGIGIT